jgi:spore coat polysaccharide biosynthesis protein SpsF
VLTSRAFFCPARTPGRAKEEFDANPVCERLDALVRELGRQSRADLCLAYLNSCSFVDSIVVGVETMDQLNDNIELFNKPPLSAPEIQKVESRFTDVPAWLLNPTEWRTPK